VTAEPGRPPSGRRLLDDAVRLLDVVQAVGARGAGAVRDSDPDAVDRIAVAVSDLAVAVRDLVAGTGRPGAPEEGGAEPGERRGPVVKHIEVTD
jgi:hypothetical protein